jgi:hypothetical protein
MALWALKMEVDQAEGGGTQEEGAVKRPAKSGKGQSGKQQNRGAGADSSREMGVQTAGKPPNTDGGKAKAEQQRQVCDQEHGQGLAQSAPPHAEVHPQHPSAGAGPQRGRFRRLSVRDGGSSGQASGSDGQGLRRKGKGASKGRGKQDSRPASRPPHEHHHQLAPLHGDRGQQPHRHGGHRGAVKGQLGQPSRHLQFRQDHQVLRQQVPQTVHRSCPVSPQTHRRSLQADGSQSAGRASSSRGHAARVGGMAMQHPGGGAVDARQREQLQFEAQQCLTAFLRREFQPVVSVSHQFVMGNNDNLFIRFTTVIH